MMLGATPSQLRQRIEFLEEENTELKEMLSSKIDRTFPGEWRLTHTGGILLSFLYSSMTGWRTHEQIRIHIYGRRMRDNKAIENQIYKLRKKVEPFGVEVLTRWGVGYGLTPASIEKLKGVIGTKVSRE
jgi:DNA-binding response OmpR family regulator